jgi:hypothetical protein
LTADQLDDGHTFKPLRGHVARQQIIESKLILHKFLTALVELSFIL